VCSVGSRSGTALNGVPWASAPILYMTNAGSANTMCESAVVKVRINSSINSFDPLP
jgi:hypothetical protein